MKIHHTNRTMNATFNLKRFLLLEQYKRNETGRHLLWSAAVVSFICILCTTALGKSARHDAVPQKKHDDKSDENDHCRPAAADQFVRCE